MKYSVKLRKVKCKSVLSSEESPWGKADGVRIFLSVFNGHMFRDVLMSGRELPPPDAVENYHFVAGKELDLSLFPPVGRPDWETEIVEVGPDGELWVCVLGFNEGLPYVAGAAGLRGPPRRPCP